MYDNSCLPPDVGVSRFVTPLQWSMTAFLGFAYPSAVAYASSKLNEYQIDCRDAILDGNTDMSIEEIQYLKSAYDFAVLHLNE